MNKLFEKARQMFALDTRSLGFVRIFLGFLILTDLLVRSTSLQAHYTDFGFLPRAALIEKFSPFWSFSIHLMNGSWQIQALLFALAAFFAFMLLIGWHTQLAAFLSWFMMVSLHNRTPWVLQAGDVYFRMLLFWAMFLPLGTYASVDQWRARQGKLSQPETVLHFGTLGYLFQICFVYWFTAWHKLSAHSFAVWWTEARAIWDALNVDQFTTPLGHWMVQLPYPLLQLIDRIVILFEILGPLLLFFPFATEKFRTFGVFALLILHLSFAACLALGPFPWVSCIAAIGLLPPWFWNQFSRFSEAFEKFMFRLFSAGENLFNKITGLSWAKIIFGSNPHTLSPVANLFAAFCIAYTFFWNLGYFQPEYGISDQFRWFGTMTGIDQRWRMFSPPFRDDGWYVIPGKLKNGSVVDLFKDGQSLSWEKPPLVSGTYSHERWRKSMMTFWLEENANRRVYYGKYLCRDWNSRHTKDEQLDHLQIFFMKEMTPQPGEPQPKPEKVSIWKHWCFNVPADTTQNWD